MGQIPGAQVCLFIELGQIGTTPHRFCPEISSSFLFVLTTDIVQAAKLYIPIPVIKLKTVKTLKEIMQFLV